MIDDSDARRRALDPGISCAVRAPAGSGKTSLLIQRVLRLLCTVDHPEQIVAITFTRKAAEEMRSRIIEALRLGAGPEPEDAYLRDTWALATAVLSHDAVEAWGLVEHPGRLRIMTIDALSQSLVRQMPLTARMPGSPAVEEDLRQLYSEAARDAVAAIANDRQARRDIARALQHVDNDWRKLENLLAEMLARRDQWLPQVFSRSEREVLQHSFSRHVDDCLHELLGELCGAQQTELLALAAFAEAHRTQADRAPADPPELTLAPLAEWQAVARIALTGKGQWRKKVDKRDGFPSDNSDNKAMKARWAETLADCREHDSLRELLDRVLSLPLSLFNDRDWETVSALLSLLKSATAHLMVLCEQGGRTDFTAFSMAALVALGEPESPTDLALSLDYQLRHLLIDEFQDTSITQFELVCRLTAGWTGVDGRSLFLVGDPMQSIYRFRQAEVSLFRQVLEQAHIGSVALEPLTLTANFRSQAKLVEWINQALPTALSGMGANAEHFVAQQARQPALGAPVTLCGWSGLNLKAEAAEVLRLVEQLREINPHATIAVLVRSRTHLGAITSTLLDAGVAVAAREIKPFTELPHIVDLIALARALLHFSDRVAWLAILRAPWCGLTLATLEQLAVSASSLPEALQAAVATAMFPPPEQVRVERMHSIMSRAQVQLGQQRFVEVLEATWLALGGPALNPSQQLIDDARALFSVVAALEQDGVRLSAERITSRLAERFSEPPVSDRQAIQIMTIHRAKGLEFDHVIVPGLGRAPRAGSRPLLLLREMPDRHQGHNLLLAPIPLKGSSPMYEYLQKREREDYDAEFARLMYVALTRAKQQVHLLGHVDPDKNDEAKPAAGSFLALLWPSIATAFVEQLQATVNDVPSARPRSGLRRAVLDDLPALEPELVAEPAADSATVEFDWAGISAKHVGSVVHRLLQDMAEAMPSDSSIGQAWRERALHYARGALRSLGVPDQALPDALDTLGRALDTTLASARGRWLFDREHSNAQSELCLADARGRIVIDRTFVDVAGQRWIVDFKTGTHSGGGRDAYLDSELLRYRPQLERYAGVMAAHEARPIMLGLYFPLLDGWREWLYQAP